MSKLDELIKALCPDGVKLCKVCEVCEIITDYVAAGSFADIAINVKYLKEKSFAQLIRTKDIKNKFNNNDFIFVDEHAFKYLKKVNLNEDSIILPNVGNCGEVYYLKPSDLPCKFNVLGPNSILLKSYSQNLKYLYYLLVSREFSTEISKARNL